MADKATAEIIESADIVTKAKGFWAKYSKKIIIVGTAIIVLGGGYLGYNYMVQVPNEKKASEMIFAAEKMFGKMAGESAFNAESVNLVLNGDKATTMPGILKVISNYGGTAAGNRAQYIAGACYLHIKQYDKAIKHLKEFDANDALQIEGKAYLMIGHAYAELKKTSDALNYYIKAANTDEKDEGMSSEAFFIAGSYAESIGKNEEAISLFKKLKERFPASGRVTSGDTEKHLARLGVTN